MNKRILNPSDNIPMDWLKFGITRKGLEEAEKGKE